MLRKNEKSVASYLIKQLPTATAFLNNKLEFVHVSDKWAENFNTSHRQIIGKNVFDIIDNASEEWKQALKDCLEEKTGKAEIKNYTTADQGEKWLKLQNTPWYDTKENVIGLILQLDDETENYLNNQKLKTQILALEEKSRIANIGVWEYNPHDETICWCNTTKRIHEVSENFTPNLNSCINFFKHGHSRNTVSMGLFKSANIGTNWSERLQLITARGKEVWVEMTSRAVLKDGVITKVVGTIQNIDEQVISELKTKENEKLMKTLIDHLPVNIYFKDTESRKVLVNKSECDYLGKTEEELLGKTDFDLYNKEVAQISRKEDLVVMHSLQPILSRETTSTKKDGSITTFLTSKIPLKGEDGKAYGLVGISLDISNLKQNEEQLRNLINVTSLQNKKLINFAHIISHNLRSHSANFSMLLDFLMYEQDEKEKENLVGMLKKASDSLLETLDNLNEVVAINTNINLEKKPINVNQKIKAVEQNLSAFLKSHETEIINKIPEDTEVQVIPAYMESILMNFITNSIKYRNPEKTPVIQLEAEKTEKYTIISIADNGIGIDLNKYGEKLFGMYKTFHNNSDARGIGLYITKNQVEAMNGKITVESAVGKGTTFKIYFNEKD